ncbi:hypothetical protein RND71_040750 [Anisodus tanguticus]|uniref:Uncharacterized protein n=1 Tax=Anisodus tanguticus TaxID=243964 RepID=A0AAE1QUL3_9SOLA|nr:hypothetical protein RND71_040750 [Anisodus tanguticus]
MFITSTHHKHIALLICIGLLVVVPEKVCSITSSQVALRCCRKQQGSLSKSQRMLARLVTKELNTNVKAETVSSNTFDPNSSSKRRVRKGSNPIHNRS